MRTFRQKLFFTLSCLLFIGIATHAQYSPGDTIEVLADRYVPTKIEAEWFDPATSFKITDATAVPNIVENGDTTYVDNLINDMILNYNVNIGSKGGTFTMNYFHKKIATGGNIRYWIDGDYLGGAASTAQTPLPADATSDWQYLEDNKQVTLTPGIHTFGIRVNSSNKHYVDHFYLVPVAGKLDSVGTTATVDITANGGMVTMSPDYGSLYNVADVVEFSAIPDENYYFVEWLGDATGTDNPLSLVLDTTNALTAKFLKIADTILLPSDRYASIRFESEDFDPATSFKITDATKVPHIAEDGNITYVDNLINDMILNYQVFVGAQGGTYTMNYFHKKIATGGNIRYWIDGDYLGGAASTAQTPLPPEATSDWQYLNDTREVMLTPGYHTFGIRINASSKHYADHFYLVPVPGSLAGAKTPATLNVTSDNGSILFNPDYGLSGYVVGDTVEITAVPNESYLFDSWAEAVTGNENPTKLGFAAVTNITANFTVDPNAGRKILTVEVPAGIAEFTLDPVQPVDGYLFGTEVTITASALVDRDHRFTAWSGDVVSTENPLVIKMDSAINIAASFEEKTTYQQNDIFYLDADRYITDTIQMDWYHTDISSGDMPTVTEDGRTFIPAAKLNNTKYLSYRIFVGESGGDYELKYIFRKQKVGGQFRLTLDGAKLYDDGETNAFNFIQMPNLVSYPGEWDEVGLALPFTLTPGLHVLRAEINASGTEDADYLTLTPVNGTLGVTEAQLHVTAVNGSVAQDPDFGIHYNLGESVNLTATPLYGFLFDGWTGDFVGTDNPLTVTMDSAIDLTANFVDDPAVADYTLTIAATDGSVEVSVIKDQYVSGTEVDLNAIPDFGYEFTGWSGDLTSTDNPVTITMDANKNITANFAVLPTYKLNLTSENGVVMVDPVLADYPKGTEITLTAMESKNYRFAGWSGDLVDLSNEIIITITSDLNVTANFELKEFFKQGDTYYIDADAYKTDTIQAEWYSIELSEEDLEPNIFVIDTIAGTDTIFVTRTRNLKAIRYPVMVGAQGGTFTMRYYYRRVAVDANNLRIDIDGRKFDGNTIGFNAVAVPSTPLGEWSNFTVGDIVLTPGYHVITIKPHYSFRHDVDFFTFDPVPGTIEVEGGLKIAFDEERGTVTKSPDKLVYDKGESVVVTAEALTGYLFSGWTGDFVGTDNPLTVIMDSTIDLTANFVAAFSVTINANTINGTVDYTPVKDLYPVGESVSFTPIPDNGYKFDGWFAEGGIGGTDIPLVIEMNRDIDLTAFFSKITYVLTTAAVNGTIEKSPSKISYDAGASVVLTAVADAGYKFDNWSGDASGTDNPLTITMDSAINVTANFSLEVGIDVNKNMSFKVYPNPSSGRFTVDISEDNVHYSISDITGRVVKNGVGSGSFVLDMTEFNKGIYAISLNTKNGVLVSRIILR